MNKISFTISNPTNETWTSTCALLIRTEGVHRVAEDIQNQPLKPGEIREVTFDLNKLGPHEYENDFVKYMGYIGEDRVFETQGTQVKDIARYVALNNYVGA